jgi:HSP20 family protein
MVEKDLETRPIRAIYCFSDEPQNQPHDNLRKRIAGRSHNWRPPTDVLEDEDAIIVRVEIAGMRDSDFTITLESPTLIIRGTRPVLAQCRAYHQMEIPFGDFSTEVEMPVPIDTGRIEATYLDGFLRIWLPKIKPQKVSIEG